MPPKPGFYAVKIGRKPGVYTTWAKCQEQVLRFSGARHKKFTRSEDAWAFANLPPPDVDQTVELLQSPLILGTSSTRNYSGSGRAQAESTGSEHSEVTKMSTLSTDPLAVFFAQYTDFEYEPARSATDEFYRLCDHYGWRSDDQQRQNARQGFQDALTLQFNHRYGTDVDDLTKWQALCAKLGIDPVPENLITCRNAVRSTHVNLVDLVDISGTHRKAHIFPTEVALSEYTIQHGKFFPRDNIHAGDLLKFLLRQIMNPKLSRKRAEGRRGRIHRVA